MMATEAGVDLEGLEVRGDPVRYRVTFDQEDVRPSAAVVAAVSTVTDADPIEMPALYDSVDPDALDALFDGYRGRERPVSVTIQIGDYEVVISNDGVVDIAPPETAPIDGPQDLGSVE